MSYCPRCGNEIVEGTCPKCNKKEIKNEGINKLKDWESLLIIILLPLVGLTLFGLIGAIIGFILAIIYVYKKT